MVLHLPSEKSILPYFCGPRRVAILDCDSHSQAGSTSSGKTHSMGTAHKKDAQPELEGWYQGKDPQRGIQIIPCTYRAVRDIFEEVAAKVDNTYVVKVSFVELYNEQLFDLLSSMTRREDTMVNIREDGKGIKTPGLTEQEVNIW